MKGKVNKYRPCNCRTVSFSILSAVLFFVSIAGILPGVAAGEKKSLLFVVIFLFLLNFLFVLYSLLKLNSSVYLDEYKILQKQFGKTISIKYDEITDVKLSFAYYIRAPYAIKIYANRKRIMFEITSRVFDEFLRCCSNIEVKNMIETLLKEKGIYH